MIFLFDELLVAMMIMISQWSRISAERIFVTQEIQLNDGKKQKARTLTHLPNIPRHNLPRQSKPIINSTTFHHPFIPALLEALIKMFNLLLILTFNHQRHSGREFENTSAIESHVVVTGEAEIYGENRTGWIFVTMLAGVFVVVGSLVDFGCGVFGGVG